MKDYLSNAVSELGYTLLDVEADDMAGQLDEGLIQAELADLERVLKDTFDPERPLDHGRCIQAVRKLYGSIMLISINGNGVLLEAFCSSLLAEIIDVFEAQFRRGQRDWHEMFPLGVIRTAIRLGMAAARAEKALDEHGGISREIIGDMLATICDAHEWTLSNTRVVEWFSAVLTRRWRFREASPGRIWEAVDTGDLEFIAELQTAR